MIAQLTARALPMRPSRHSARRALALLCIMLGIAGCILPLIPGLPFFVLGGRLLGRRDPMLRSWLLHIRRQLRGMRRSRWAPLRRLGLRLTPQWRLLVVLMLGA